MIYHHDMLELDVELGGSRGVEAPAFRPPWQSQPIAFSRRPRTPGLQISPVQTVSPAHPIRQVRAVVDQVLTAHPLPAWQVGDGCTIAPGAVLAAMILQFLHAPPTDRQFAEQLAYNLMYRWFLAIPLEAPGWDAEFYARHRERLLRLDQARDTLRITIQTLDRARLLADPHFAPSETLASAWAPGALLVFEDLVEMDGRSLQVFCRNLDSRELALSLVGKDASFRQRMLRGVSARMATIIEDELIFLRPVRLLDVLAMREKHVRTARRLAEIHEIVLPGRLGEALI